MSLRLGVFGGTFDPPHIGHMILAAEAKAQLSLDRVLWVLTPHPPHKSGLQITSVEHRLALLQAGVGQDPDFEISSVDIERPPPHFAVDTLRLLHDQYRSAKLVYLMGSDSLDDLPGWHDPEGFVKQIDELGVMCRPGREIDLGELAGLLPGLSERVHILEAPLLEISSTSLRHKIAAGGPYRYYFPPTILELIDKLKLYRDPGLQV